MDGTMIPEGLDVDGVSVPVQLVHQLLRLQRRREEEVHLQHTEVGINTGYQNISNVSDTDPHESAR